MCRPDGPEYPFPGATRGIKTALRASQSQKGGARPAGAGGLRAGRGRKNGPGHARDTPCMATGSPRAGFSAPNTPPGSHPGEKNGSTGFSGKNGGIARRKTQQRTCPQEGKSSKGGGAGGKPPKAWRHWRSEARRAAFRAGRPPFFSPLGAATSPRGLRKAQEGPAHHSGSRSPPATGQDGPDAPTAGAATHGTGPSQPVRAERTETRRDLQAAASGARTAPIMKCRPARLARNPPAPAGRAPIRGGGPIGHLIADSGKTGQGHPVRRGLRPF